MRLKELLLSRDSESATHVKIDLPTDDVLKEIVNERRREILLTLAKEPGLSIRDMSAMLWERERVRQESEPKKHSVYVSVKQNHIPRLVESELVAVSDESVWLTDRGDSTVEIVQWLDMITSDGGQS